MDHERRFERFYYFNTYVQQGVGAYDTASRRRVCANLASVFLRTQSRKRWVFPTLRLLPLLGGAAIYASMTALGSADVGTVNNNLAGSMPFIMSTEKICSKLDGSLALDKYQLTTSTRLPQWTGNVSEFGVTAHIYATLLSKASFEALVVNHNIPPVADRKSCSTLIVFNVSNTKLKVGSAFRDGRMEQHLTRQQMDLVTNLRAFCESSVSDGSRMFLYGGYKRSQSGSNIVSPEFNCATAVRNNVSIINVSAGHFKVRVTVIYDTVYIEEI